VIFLRSHIGAKKLPDIGEGLGKTVREIESFEARKRPARERTGKRKAEILFQI